MPHEGPDLTDSAAKKAMKGQTKIAARKTRNLIYRVSLIRLKSTTKIVCGKPEFF